MKKTSEELIDQALTTIRQTQPPVGMPQRILAQTENYEAKTSSRNRGSFLKQLGFSRVWQPALAGTAVVVCIAMLTFTHSHRSQQPLANVAQKRQLELSADSPSDESFAMEAVLPVHTRRTTRKGSVLVEAQPAHVETAVDDMHLPSHPAPEMTLTYQDEALLHITDHHDSVLIARLDQVERAIARAQQSAEFDKFFAPPPPLPGSDLEKALAANVGSPDNKTSTSDQPSLQPTKDTTTPSTGDHQ